MGDDDNRDVATVFPDGYSRSAPAVLGDQHRFLLDSLEAGLANKKYPTLLVLGSGGYVLPYSCKYTEDGKLGTTNRDRIKKIIGNGKIVLADYVVDYEKSGLVKGLDVMTQMGFFEQGYFRAGCFIHDGRICTMHTHPGTISFIKNNLRDKLMLEDESVDAVDANLSIHHASVTRAELGRVYNEIFRVLKPGGILHLGEGNVSMNYTEDKLIRIGQDIAELSGIDVYLDDFRESNNGYVLHAMFEPGRKYSALPVIGKQDHKGTIIVSSDGQVIIQTTADAEKTAKELQSKGYCSARACARTTVTMPLIDSLMPEDVKGHIVPVDRFYEAINSRIVRGYSAVDKDLVEKAREGLEDERAKAKKGIVEYYVGEQQILSTLKFLGFTNIQSKHHETEPFYNITARKAL